MPARRSVDMAADTAPPMMLLPSALSRLPGPVAA